MKTKILLIATLLAFGFLTVNAQAVKNGDKILNLGIGLGSPMYSGSYYSGTVPPLSASLEVIIKDQLFDGNGALGVGGYVGYSAYKYDYQGWGYKYGNLFIGARGNVHYSFLDNLDTYAGLFLGYDIVTSTEFGNAYPGYDYSYNTSRFIGSIYVGGRYFFNDKFAGMLELGSGITYLNIGVALKF
jgi:hypothetical protein